MNDTYRLKRFFRNILIWLIVTLTCNAALAAQGKLYKFSNGQNLPINFIGSNDVIGLCGVQISAMPQKYIGIASIVNYPGGGGYCEYWFNVVGGPGKNRNYFYATNITCANDEKFDPVSQSCVKVDRPRCTVSNPIDPLNGEKIQTVTDLIVKRISSIPITVERYYKSNFLSGARYSMPDTNPTYISGWGFKYTDSLESTVIKGTATSSTQITDVVVYKSPLGQEVRFYYQNNEWISPQIEFQSMKLVDLVENGVAVKVLSDKTTVKTFNSKGLLTKYKYVGGPELTFEYKDSSTNQYSIVWDTIVVKYQNLELFRYKVTRIVMKGGFKSMEYFVKEVFVGTSRKLEYDYSSAQNLIGIRKYPDNTYTQYHYESLYDNKLLTGITDSKNIRYATWIYDSNRRVISAYHANNADKTDLAFYPDKVTVTNSLNKNTTFHFSMINDVPRITRVEGEPSTNCAGANQYITYTSDGLIQSKTDWNGIITIYEYNSEGQEISRTEAVGTAEEQTVLTEWHPTLSLVTKVTTTETETTFEYDSAGLLTAKIIQSAN